MLHFSGHSFAEQFVTSQLRSQGLFHTITNACIACDACPDACPAQAIEAQPRTYVIREDTCIDCGSCVAVCPIDAIQTTVRQDRIPEAWTRHFEEQSS